jgi:cytochrome b561
MNRLFDTRQEYGGGSIAIHWVVALVTLTLLVTGYVLLFMARGPAKGDMISFHTGIGWILALLVIVRLLWRVINPLPRLLTGEPWENVLARVVQWSMILLLVAFAVTGYLSVATSPRLQSVSVLGWFDLPKLNDLGRALHRGSEEVHLWISHVFAAFLLLHVVGAVKRQFVDRDGTLRRMIWLRRIVPGAAG